MRWKRKRIGNPNKAVYISEGLDQQIRVEIFPRGYNVISGEGTKFISEPLTSRPFPYGELKDTLKKLNIDEMPHVPKKFVEEYKPRPGEGPIK
ncbi:MAG: hypothetical protein V3U72_01630 [Candidatus Aenigmarchaeota archaeon]